MLKHTPLKEPCINQRRDVNIIKETPLKRCRYQLLIYFIIMLLCRLNSEKIY